MTQTKKISRNDASMLNCFFVSNSFDSKLYTIIQEMEKMHVDAESEILRDKISKTITNLEKALAQLQKITNEFKVK